MEKTRELSGLDLHTFSRDVVIKMAIIFVGALDEELLKKSLNDVITNHYPIFGSRLKSKSGGLFDYAIPAEFDENNRPFEWLTKDKSAQSISVDFDIRKLFLTSSNNAMAIPIQMSGLNDYSRLFTVQETSHKSYLNKNRSMVSIYCSKYSDYTAFLFAASHMLCDGHGLRLLLTAWEDALHGRPVTPIQTDYVVPPSQIIGSELCPIQPLSTWQMIRIAANVGWQILRNGKAVPKRLSFSLEFIESLRKKCQQMTKLPISKYDILCAIATKLSAVGRTGRDFDKMVVGTVANIRNRVAGNENYPHNFVMVICDTLSSNEISKMTFLELVVRLKSYSSKFTKGPNELLSMFNLMEKNKPQPCAPYPFDFALGVTHWGNFRFQSLDFSVAACDKNIDGAGLVKVFEPFMEISLITNVCVVLFDDGLLGSGRAILNLALFKSHWAKAEKELGGIENYLKRLIS
ncbi:hypothetical protein V1517DRAFT_308177 [Lipomyces orientalis]|uniref:Uncharacterized protein n=1 Tax=Lipomyces orientalis TaxID=1233043 RepID=A0ACC3TN36_9ASCO